MALEGSELQTCCRGLESGKVTERKKCAELLQNLIQNKTVKSILSDENSHVTWSDVVSSVHKYLIKEAEKFEENERKNKSFSHSAASFNAKTYSDFLITVIYKANSKEVRLSASKLVEYVIQYFESRILRKYYSSTYLTILKDHILSVKSYCGKIQSHEWTMLLSYLKSFHRKPPPGVEELKPLQCLQLLLQRGPLHCLPGTQLREEFPFVTQVAQQINPSSSRLQQETVLKLLLEFCVQMAEDNRMACCKLGEGLFGNLIGIYQSHAPDNIKIPILEFFLLQIQIHHPRGATEGSVAAYACSWLDWHKNLRSLYSILCNEINNNVQVKYRTYSILTKQRCLDMLDKTFAALLVEVFKQVFSNRAVNLSLDVSQTPECSQPPSKRQKVEIGVPAIISNIQESKNWPWINAITELLKKYPTIITPSDFVWLLRILSAQQAECKFSNIRYHLYECLAVLVDVEMHIDISEYVGTISSMWTNVWDCTLRAVGLNENEQQTHKLLQKLIVERKISNSVQLFKTYMSHVLNITEHSLQTLNDACIRFGLPEGAIAITANTGDSRKALLKWILNIDIEKPIDTDVFSELITAQVLLFLTFKQWPCASNTTNRCTSMCSSLQKHESIEYVYLITSFDGGLVLGDDKDMINTYEAFRCDDRIYLSHIESFDYLNELLEEFVNTFVQAETKNFDTAKNLVNVTILLSNILSLMVQYNILQENKVQTHKLTQLLILSIENCASVVQKLLDEFNNKKKVNNMQDLLKQINKLFGLKLHDSILLLIKKNVPIEFIKKMFELLNDAQDDTENEKASQENSSLHLSVLNVLCSFACVPNANCVFDVQEQVLQTLADPSFDPKIPSDYETIIEFLNSLQKCKPGTLSDKLLEMILQCLQTICQECYTNYDTALSVLKILYYLYPHIAQSYSEELEENSVTLLQEFYLKRDNYGPDVSVALLNCMGQLAKVDPDASWSKWTENNEQIVTAIPHFLNSDFQKVRLAAIKNLYIVFNSSPKNAAQVAQQNLVFNTVSMKCMEVFNVAGNLSEERKVDETVTRTASALHTFATIMVTNAFLRRKSLFALLKLVHEKQLNIESALRILEMVTKHMSLVDTSSLLELNLNYLVSQWEGQNLALNEFPYSLLGCKSAIEFYSKYTHVMVPLLIADNSTLLTEVCQQNGRSLEETIEISYPNIISRCLLVLTSESSMEYKISHKEAEFKLKCFQNLTNILTDEKLDQLLVAKLDEVVVSIIQFCFDSNDMNNKFSIHCALPEPHQPYFPVATVLKTFNHIENKYLNGEALIIYCIRNCPEKLQQVLLKTVAHVYKATSTEDKAKAFHQYTLIVDQIIPRLKNNDKLNVYIIRTISYTLIHLIRKDYKTDSILNVMCCKYFGSFISQILPENAKVLEQFLVTFVSILIPIARCNNNLGVECTNLLNLIIVDCVTDLRQAIKTLDPFPQEDKFFRMQEVYKEVKYSEKSFTLENEIEHFLKTGILMGSSGYRTEGLKHLKNQLSIKKTELKELYAKLHKLRGFSEDCEESILHKLICALVKLSLSPDPNESVEAARCLGELGSSDLLTTVLQAEQKCEYENWNPFELVTGCVVALLSKYIIDTKIQVMQVASEALYHVLDCKEGKSVLDSNINYGYGTVNKAYVTPFVSSRKIRSDTSYSLKNTFEDFVTSNSLWYPEGAVTHEEWISKLVCTFLNCFTDKCYLKHLIPVCEAKVTFAEELLPLLVYLVLFSGYADSVSAQIQRFFRMHWTLSLHGHDSSKNVAVNKLSVQCMLNVVNFIRLRKNVTNRNLGNFTLNYLHVAQAAQFCTAHFTALLYVELWSQERIKELRVTGNMSFGLTPLDIIFQYEEPDIRHTLQNILRESYKKVGDLDSLQTCETIGLLDSRLCVEHYEHLQRWEQVALLYDIQISQGNSDCTPKLLNALKNCSLFQLPLKYQNSVEPQFECAWRLSQWNINKTDTENSENYEKYKYFALKALHNNDTSNFKSAIADARNSVINNLRHASLESSKNLYEPLSQLQALLELEDFDEAKSESIFKPLFKKWTVQDDMNRNEFQYIEPIQAQRIVVLNDLVTSGRDTVKDALIEMHLKLAALARIEGKQNVANRALRSLLHITDLKPEIKNQIMMEEAQLTWLDDKTTARYILRNLVTKVPSPRLRAAALKLYGTWMVETCSENPQTIISDYFMESLKILNDLEKTDIDKTNICDTYDVLARFADSQYQQVLSYIKSTVFERKVQNMEKSKETAANIKKQASGRPTADETRAMITYERQSLIDKTEISNTYKEKNMYLVLAMKYYMWNLMHSDANNIRMFRVLSLWLENRSTNDYIDIEKVLDKYLSEIPSYKFVPILPQLVPHISSTEDSFSCTINSIIERCIIDHPHHTLPIVLALANSNKDRNYYKSTTNTISNEPRVTAAEKLIEKFQNNHSLKKIIHRMDILAKALMELAYLDQNSCRADKKENFVIPEKCNITKIRDFDDVLLPTYTLPVQKNCNYSNIVGIHHFSKTFANVGGLNAPKRICCMGSDGQLRNQLVKGKDDLRQDAVMQQVFNIMNGLLASNKQTVKLLIRTYKIVPLSQRSGILEWVENSMPIGEYLVGKDGKSGAHPLYNRDDVTPAKCRLEFKNCAKLPNSEKLKVYKNICNRFQPVFHKFFEHSFIQPAVWYERRRAYMYSVATSSMCGYILGLGDRHVNNILIDKRTAEVVHIDFGIAFEQGQVLPTPETVPFRLTRDIEVGMGVSGIEGVFRKSCERTLEVLRKNSETIITILEVLLYDPLYAWTVTPAEAYSRQMNYDHDGSTAGSSHSIEFSDQESVNVTAERALLRLRQKLQGTAEGGSTSIEGQVEKLLQQARDPSNLSRLFHGWQPYL